MDALILVSEAIYGGRCLEDLVVELGIVAGMLQRWHEAPRLLD